MRSLAVAALGALVCTGCVSGQGSSFATRVGGSGGSDPSGFAADDGFAADTDGSGGGFTRGRRRGLLASLFPNPAGTGAASGERPATVLPANPGDYGGRPILASSGNVLLPPNLGVSPGGLISVDQSGNGPPTVGVAIGGAAVTTGQPTDLGGATSTVLASLGAITSVATSAVAPAIDLAGAEASAVLAPAVTGVTAAAPGLASALGSSTQTTVAQTAVALTRPAASPVGSPVTTITSVAAPVVSPAVSPVIRPAQISSAAPALNAPKPVIQPVTAVDGGAVRGVLTPVASAPTAAASSGNTVKTVVATGTGVGQAVAGTVAAVADPATVAIGLGGLAGRHR